jgi:diaminobutyrate-2-oxoglutarate transaminase
LPAGRRKSIACSSPVRPALTPWKPLKLAKKYTGRSAVISFSGGYRDDPRRAVRHRQPVAESGGQRHDAGSPVYALPHLYRCPLGIGEAGVKALTYYFENLINDVEAACVNRRR